MFDLVDSHDGDEIQICWRKGRMQDGRDGNVCLI